MKTPFQVELLSMADRDLKSFWQFREQIVEAILELENNPEKGHKLQQNLQDINALEITIKGSGQYRVAYVIQEEDQICTVFAIGPHENFYAFVARRATQLKALLAKVRAAKRKSAEPILRVNIPKKSNKKTPQKRPQNT